MGTVKKELPKTIVIRITQEDIARGVAGDCTYCPAARAVSRRFPGYYVSVNGVTARIASIGPYMVAGRYVSNKLSEFVRDFDKGNPVKPTRIVLTRA